jgi:hypothetical protein
MRVAASGFPPGIVCAVCPATNSHFTRACCRRFFFAADLDSVATDFIIGLDDPTNSEHFNRAQMAPKCSGPIGVSSGLKSACRWFDSAPGYRFLNPLLRLIFLRYTASSPRKSNR